MFLHVYRILAVYRHAQEERKEEGYCPHNTAGLSPLTTRSLYVTILPQFSKAYFSSYIPGTLVSAHSKAL